MTEIRAAEAGHKAREQLLELTGLKLHAVSSIRKSEDGWTVAVDLVERHAIPDAQDLLATYEVRLDGAGEMLGYDRKRRFLRREIGIGEES